MRKLLRPVCRAWVVLPTLGPEQVLSYAQGCVRLHTRRL
jgi:hypothetical protein